jgi:uncharacterized protein (UPF0276 family)
MSRRDLLPPEWRAVPARGVGMVWMPGLAPAIAEAGALLDFLEVEPQQHWRRGTRPDATLRVDEAALDAITARGLPVVLHSVGCPIGGTAAAPGAQVEALRAAIARFDPAWVSEHLAFDSFGLDARRAHAGFLMPPLPCAASARVAVRRARDLRDALLRPLAIENGVSYLRPQPGEWSDGSFLRVVAEEADCGILLDLHNAWTNHRNGRQSIDAFLGEIPLGRVVELHLAGGELHEGYWLDAHSGPSPGELLALAADLVPQLPNLRGITFEMMDEALGTARCDVERLHEELGHLRALWDRRRAPRAITRSWSPAEPRGHPATVSPPPPSPADWEDTLCGLVLGFDDDTLADPALARRLRDDPGLGVLRTLVEAVRAGTVVDTLRGTCRLLYLGEGRNGLAARMSDFWRTCPPQAFATDEALAFGAFLLAQAPDVPGLVDQIRIELAACRALADGEPVSIEVAHHPAELAEALAQSRLPPRPPAGQSFTLQIEPPG